MKKLFGAFVIVITVVVLMTCLCFSLIVPKPYSALAWINFVLIVIFELLGLSSIFIVTTKKGFNTQNIALARLSLKYIGVSSLIMIFFGIISLTIEDYISYVRFYYVALIGCAIIYFLRFVGVFYGGKIQQESAAISIDRLKTSHDFAFGNDLAHKLKSINNNPNISANDRILIKRNVESAIGALKSIPVNQYLKTESVQSKLPTFCEELGRLLESFHKEDVQVIVIRAKEIVSICSQVKQS